jgi:hypothetical protein
MFLIGLILIGLTVYIGFRFHISHRRLIPISVLALIAGVIFEGRNLSDNWKIVSLKALGAFVLSFFAFLPGKNESNYNFENHIELWPYVFIIIFLLISIVIHGDKVVQKLTEGITLLQSMAVIYWVVDYGFFNTDSLFLKSLMTIGLLFSLYSVFHAFSHAVLSPTSRLTLSIWSSIILMLFAIDNIFRVYQNQQIEDTEITQGFIIGLQYFLLGVSSIYIVQNLLMLIGFLPGKGTFFNEQYFRELRQVKAEHINRYSDRQVSILHSSCCVLFTGSVFALNYYYQILPRHTAIWIVFVIFPFVLKLYDTVSKDKTANKVNVP